MQASTPSPSSPSAPGDPAHSALHDLKALVRDAEELLTRTSDAAEEQVSEMHDRLRHAIERSRERLRTVQAAAKVHMQECDTYVRSHPYQSVGAAFAVGALLGLLLGRRSS